MCEQRDVRRQLNGVLEPAAPGDWQLDDTDTVGDDE